MKPFLFVLAIGLFVFSCSSDSSENTDDSNTVTGDYFPLNMDNSWMYDVTNVSPTNPQFNYTETDIVTLNSLSSNTFTINVNAPADVAHSTANTIFNSGSMTKTDNSLTFTGNVGLFSELESISNASVALTNFTVYDTNASINSVLETVSDSFSQNENFDGFEAPVTTNYTMTSTNLTPLNSLTVNGVAYANVIHTQIKVNAHITVLVNLSNGITTTVNILSPQDVLIIDNYFAKDIGLIRSVANQSFTVDNAFIQMLNLLNAPTDFDTEGSVTNTQDISGYTITN